MSLKCDEDKSLNIFFNEFESSVRNYKSAGGCINDIEVIVDMFMAMPSS